MGYEWDPVKASANVLKHGVAFDAIEAFDWDAAIIGEDLRKNYGEARFFAVGPIEAVLHVVIFTRRASKVRLISLRRANERERRRYERA